VRRAIALLAEEGYVVTVPGRGTYVASKLPE
jgi:DNA-binding GntR family transcriptional regulator